VSSRVLYLIRHGRSDLDVRDYTRTAQGEQYDPPLGSTGKEQAELLARRLVAMRPPAAVYCSPLRRARETVAPYVERTGAEVHYDDDLVEAHIGEWEYKTFEEILESDEAVMRNVLGQEAIWHLAPGAEMVESLRRRVARAIDRMLERHPEGDLFVICHGGVINACLGPLLGIENEMFFLPENTSLNSVVVDGDERRVRFLNDILHLTDPHLFERT
jgi:broad specificity phosphatase PhoE